MITLIVACVSFSALIPGPATTWLVAPFDHDSGGYLAQDDAELCGKVGQSTSFVLVSGNITTAPETVGWLEDYDMNHDGVIGVSDVMAQTNLVDFAAASERLGEINDGKQVIE